MYVLANCKWDCGPGAANHVGVVVGLGGPLGSMAAGWRGVRPVRSLLPRAHTSFSQRLIPLYMQSPAFFSTNLDPDPTASLPAVVI